IAMARLCRMYKMRRRPCRGKCRGDFARYMARFPHAADDHAPMAAENDVDGAAEIAVERAGERVDRLSRAVEHTLRRLHVALGWSGRIALCEGRDGRS